MKNCNIGIINLTGAENLVKNLDKYLIHCEIQRFKTGEAKAILKEDIKDKNIYILVDVCNNSIQYEINGYKNHMSPDDHYQNLKRVINVVKKQTNNINVIMPYLYEGRQSRNFSTESSDCNLALEELFKLGVKVIITFDIHDSNILNEVNNIYSIRTNYYLLKTLFEEIKDLSFENLMVISPDRGAIIRCKDSANILKVNLGVCEKNRKSEKIISCKYHGDSVKNKDIIIIDDMISSGETILKVAQELKKQKARRIFVLCSFGLFTNGFNEFDKSYEKGVFDKIISTNLTYQKPELFTKEYYKCVDMSDDIENMITEINKEKIIPDLNNNLKKLVEKYKNYQK